MVSLTSVPTDVPAGAARAAHLAGRALFTAVVRRLPPALAEPLRRPDARGPLVRMARSLLRRGGVPGAVRTFRLADNPALWFVNADSPVLQQLYWFGEEGWEPELLPWWRRLCETSAGILELGANVGYFTVQGATAAPAARYTAVEPHPVSAAVCRRNLALNGIDTVHLVEAAATDRREPGRCALLVPWEQRSTPTVAFLSDGSELPASMSDRPGSAITVPTVDVRPLLRGVDVVKLDVEGHEHVLLRAGWEEVRAYRPTVVVELLPGTTQLRRVLYELCDRLGYRCYAPTRHRLVPLAPDRLATVDVQREYRTNDVILTVRHDW